MWKVELCVSIITPTFGLVYIVDWIARVKQLQWYLCFFVDRLTKRAHFIPINNQFSSKDIVQLLYDKVYPLHGLPLQIILDREVQYLAKLFQE